MTNFGFLAYAGALGVAAVIPGPQILGIVAHGLRRGYRHAVSITMGMVLGDLIYITIVLAGLALIAETLSRLLIVLKWGGVAYLIWLAIQYWQSSTEGEDPELKIEESAKSAFASGILVTLGNPKSMLFYISIMPTIVRVSSITKVDAFLLLVITAVVLTGAQLPFALAAARSRHLFSSPKRLRLIKRGASTCMGGAAVAIALRK